MKSNPITLDKSLPEFEELIHKTVQLVLNRYKNIETADAYSKYTPLQVREWFNEPLPQEGMDMDALFAEIKEKILDTATLNIGPKFYAYVVSGGNQVSILAEFIAAALNQNVAKWHLAPAMSEIEMRVIQWTSKLLGFSNTAGGVLVSGGSAANLTGLTVARNTVFEKHQIRKKGLFAMKPLTIYASEETHSCIDKSVELLGIGTDHYRKIPVNKNYEINTIKLTEAIENDIKNGFQPFCLVGSIGTVNTGATDAINELADIAKKYNLWFHIDGAYGGLVASLDWLKNKVKGIDRADSLAVDFHKWLYQPFEAGCLLVKNWDTLKDAYFKSASYLTSDVNSDGRKDFTEHHFQLSRNAKALKVWMSIKAYGINKIKRAIQNDIDIARFTAKKITEYPDFELCTPSNMSIACFRYVGSVRNVNANPEKIDKLNQLLIPALEKDGRIFFTGTKLKNRPVLRACFINHRLKPEHALNMLQIIREVGQEVEKSL